VHFLHASPGTLGHLYNALWYPALPLALIATGGRDQLIRRQRMGRIRLDQPRSGAAMIRVWIHAASVGEVEAVRPVLKRLMSADSRVEVVMTTMTAAGCDAARRRITGLIACQLAPLDFASSVRSFLADVRPHLILIAETELWPNFFGEGARVSARIAIINGRLSERSMRRYSMVRGLIAHTLGHAEKILVQTPADAQRFRALGAPTDRVIVTGNTKFDLDDRPAPLRSTLAEFALGRPILLAGSTAPGEERMVLEAYRNLIGRFPNLALAVAPRHLDRVVAVEEDLREAGLPYAKASSPAPAAGNSSILLIDTMGELRAFYYRAAIAFVGGSMNPPRGGQSMAEPAAAAIPILFGPHHENQRQIAEALLEAGGAVIVNDGGEIETQCAAWLANEPARRATGQAARHVIEHLADGATLTAEHLRPMLETRLTKP
jgi:3-deoxy-D-manno-octulosonic-acid transferase